MTRNALIPIVALLAICIISFYLWTARVARKESNDIRANFKKTDSSIIQKFDSTNKQPGTIGAFKTDSSYPAIAELSLSVNKISLIIDSIKKDLLLVRDKDHLISFSGQNKKRLKNLKDCLADYNSLIQKEFQGKSDIHPDDFIELADKINGTNFIPWETYYFANTNFYSATTLLTFVHQKVFSLQQKAIKGG